MATPTQIIVQGVAATGLGAAQRVAWDQNDMIGWVVSGGLALAGSVGMFMLRGGMAQDLSMAAAGSGYTVLGWQLTDRFVLQNSPASIASRTRRSTVRSAPTQTHSRALSAAGSRNGMGGMNASQPVNTSRGQLLFSDN